MDNKLNYYIPQNMILRENNVPDQDCRPNHNYLFYDIILNHGKIYFFSWDYIDFKIDFDKIKIIISNTEYKISKITSIKKKSMFFGLVVGIIDLKKKIESVNVEVLYKNKKKKFYLEDHSKDFKSQVILQTFFWHDIFQM